MKALLMAAAILAPALALANDPALHDSSAKKASTKKNTNVTDMTSTQVLGKLRVINQTSIEMAGIAQSNSQSSAVKNLASRMSKEHQKLDTRVTDYATKNNIVLASGELKDDVVPLTPSEATTYDRDRGPATERPGANTDPSNNTQGYNRSGTDMTNDSPSTASRNTARDTSTGSTASQMGSNDKLSGPGAMGYRGATEAGSTPQSAEKGTSNDRMAADSPSLTGSEAYPEVPGANEKMAQRQASIDQLRALNGAAFDREFLSRVVDKGTRWIGILQDSKGKFDKTVDAQITGTIDQLKKDVSDAQRLQATLRAS